MQPLLRVLARPLGPPQVELEQDGDNTLVRVDGNLLTTLQATRADNVNIAVNAIPDSPSGSGPVVPVTDVVPVVVSVVTGAVADAVVGGGGVLPGAVAGPLAR